MTSLRHLRLPALALASLFAISACLADPAPTLDPVASASIAPTAEPTAQPAATATAAPEPTRKPRVRRDETLVVMAPEHPRRLLPGNDLNATERLLVDVLYDPLYRLDENMQPVPELAKGMPEISKDGKTWTVKIKADARFHSGKKLRADDVTFSLRMAASPSCPLGRDLCATVGTYLDGDPKRDDNVVTIKLTEPYSPFLAEALARLPILSEDDVKEATAELVDAAERLNENRPDKVITRIYEQTLRPKCVEADPPRGCRLADYREELEQIFKRAKLELPSHVPYTDEAGIFYEDTYLGDLLKRLEALAQIFDSSAADLRSAALGLLDATVQPLGGGPYELVATEDEGTYTLKANKNHTRGAPRIDRMQIRVQRDPSVAVTRLLSDEADWVLEMAPDQIDLVAEAPGFDAAARPLDTQFGILFNVRPERIYFDVDTRRAFVLCIDHEGLAAALAPHQIIATTPYTATSWALPESAAVERDVAAANALLDRAGWPMATDGVRVREDGQRLSTSIAVRPTSVDLFTFANQAAEQLSECGIELFVDELDLTGDTMLNQLRWPNDFDTLMWTRRLGPDPDSAVRAFESSRITTADNVADENPSGFTSSLADHLIASSRESYDQDERTEAYAGVQELLEEDIPYWPLWYDSAASAVSTRLQDRRGPIDPSRSRYDWDVSSWSLEPVSDS